MYFHYLTRHAFARTETLKHFHTVTMMYLCTLGINTRSSACEPDHCWSEYCTNTKDRVFGLSIVQEAIAVYDKNEPKKHHGKVNDTLRLYWATQQTMVAFCCHQTVTKCQRHDTQHWTTTVFLSLWDSQVYVIEL